MKKHRKLLNEYWRQAGFINPDIKIDFVGFADWLDAKDKAAHQSVRPTKTMCPCGGEMQPCCVECGDYERITIGT